METQVRESVISEVGGTAAVRRSPHLLLSEGEVRAAVEECLRHEWFVVDIESKESAQAVAAGSPNPLTNRVIWVGLGIPGRVFLIPCGHPQGRTLSERHKIKVPAFTLYGPDDPRSYTKTGKISMRGVDQWVDATFAPKPKQLRDYELMLLLQPLLFSDRAKIGHNLKFDLKSLGKYYGRTIPGPYHDTILLRHVLDENLAESRSRGYGLKELTEAWLGYNPWPNSSIGKNPSAHGLDDVARYLARDIRFCQMMFQLHEPKLDRFQVRDAYEFEMELYPIIMEMEFDGISVDTSKRGEVSQYLNTEIARVEEAAYQLAGDRFVLSNTHTKRWVMFGEGDACWGEHRKKLRTEGLAPLSRTEKTDTAQINQAALEHYAEKGNEMAALLLEWSSFDKLRGTFVDGMDRFLVDRGDMPPTLHTGYKQHGTVTGRLSSEKPNLQQLPREE